MKHFKALLARLVPSAIGRRTGVRAVVFAFALGTSVFAVQSPSMADEDFFEWCGRAAVHCQTGIVVSSFTADKCVQELYEYTIVCIKYSGDYVYVYDGKSDNRQGIASISTPTTAVQGRWCRNPSIAGTWARCHFDWDDSVTKAVYGGTRGGYEDANYTRLWTFDNN